MQKNPKELDKERLATTNEHGHRIFLYPEDVKGYWKSLREKLYWILILIYLILPWVYYKGEQVILLNLSERKFVFFGNIIWGHDAPIFIFIFLAFAFAIALITTLYGRIWCGFLCPQTVFIHALYSKIELFIEGKARQRKKLDLQKLSLEKIAKKSAKWILFIAISLHIAHSFVGYFVGTRYLLTISLQSPFNNWEIFLTTMILTGIILFDFGWFKEQFCIIMCPYGRFQSILMDDQSVCVTYDQTRGEPRRTTVPREQEGDCVNCYQCVAVCPTGIDIRRGLQMECIGCTQCIDACDDIMERIKKPKGLIRFTSNNQLNKLQNNIFRPRILIYLGAIILITSTFFFAYKTQKEFHTLWIRDRVPFQEIKAENKIINHFNLEIFYKETADMYLIFVPIDPEIKLITPMKPYHLKSGRKSLVNIFFNFSKNKLINGNLKTEVKIFDNDKEIKKIEVNLVGPIH